MKNHIIDTLGQTAARHTTSFNMALTGVVSALIYGAAPTAPSTLSAYTRDEQSVESSYLTTMAQVIDEGLADVVAAAAESANVSLTQDQAMALVRETVPARNELLGQLAALAHKNGMTASRRVRDFVTRVDLSVMNGRNSMSGALVAARIVESQVGMTFRAADTLGRSWKTTDYAAAMVKGVLQTAYADTFARAAALAGHDLIRVIYADQQHDNHGLVLSLSGAKGKVPFMSARDEIFHPNSTATLELAGGDRVPS
ncbi:hypothetical protein [Burkholderia vietnamiensis]|uniref:hypothetical protein n=1 Tax=Burkholderia vietnamiensis TaxID=60552 RepID=UPI001CAB7DE0|nr:hypothetical protein [Burkholderia vietnamiensis]CAG9228848.1 hypothetical protein BVI1335_70108 [Burkholderia vietnamiensis]